MNGQTSRRAFLGLAAAGAAGAVSACSGLVRSAGGSTRPVAATASPWRAKTPENSLPGTSDWVIRHLGAEHEIEGYAGKASVLAGESIPLFVSTTTRGFTVTAYRLGWYQGHGAREVWKSKALRGGAQQTAAVSETTRTVTADWDPVLDVPTADWPAGAYLLVLAAESGARRYVPVTVRSASCAGKVVLKNCVQTWQAYNTWGGYDLYKGPSGGYGERSLVVSLDRPYDDNGANMFLTYERNVIKLAEQLSTARGGLDLAYVTSMDIAADPHLLDGASALISMGHDEYWTPQERANVTAARDKGVNLAFFGANALFRRTRLEPTATGAARQVVCYKTDYRADPAYAKDPAEVTSDWREPPNSAPESSLTGTIYEGYPVDAAFVVSSPKSWVYAGTGVPAGASFPHLVGVEYDRVNPAYPVERPLEVLSHSPLTCNGTASYGDSAYYTHPGGAGVYNSGTMRWVEAIYGDQPHGIGGATPAFVRQVTANVLRAFAEGPAAAKHPANDNLTATGERDGSPISPGNLQLSPGGTTPRTPRCRGRRARSQKPRPYQARRPRPEAAGARGRHRCHGRHRRCRHLSRHGGQRRRRCHGHRHHRHHRHRHRHGYRCNRLRRGRHGCHCRFRHLSRHGGQHRRRYTAVAAVPSRLHPLVPELSLCPEVISRNSHARRLGVPSAINVKDFPNV